MQAVIYRRLGAAAEVLEQVELDTPVPAEGEVRVRLRASGVNPSDVKNRAGKVFSDMPFPVIVPHSDGAGVIDAVGKGVPESRVGERVWIWNGQFRRQFGTCAEYIALPSQQAVPLPDPVSFEEGACLGIPALTAYRAVTFGQSLAGKTVLVAGGGGAVGHYAVQFAKLKGARVIATAGSPARAAHARAAGADYVLDYKHDDLRQVVRQLTDGEGADRIVEVEFGLNADKLADLVRQEGVVYVYGSAGDMRPRINVQQLMMRGVTMHFRSVYLMPWQDRAAAIADITGMMRQGRLRHAVGASFGLDRIVAAHEAVESGGTIGNVVIGMQG